MKRRVVLERRAEAVEDVAEEEEAVAAEVEEDGEDAAMERKATKVKKTHPKPWTLSKPMEILRLRVESLKLAEVVAAEDVAVVEEDEAGVAKPRPTQNPRLRLTALLHRVRILPWRKRRETAVRQVQEVVVEGVVAEGEGAVRAEDGEGEVVEDKAMTVPKSKVLKPNKYSENCVCDECRPTIGPTNGCGWMAGRSAVCIMLRGLGSDQLMLFEFQS